MKFTRDDYNRRIVDLDKKIPEDEPVFLLRAQDLFAPSTLRHYASYLSQHGNNEMAEELYKHASNMVLWQKTKQVKLPDK
jgi:hypothetical protein